MAHQILVTADITNVQYAVPTVVIDDNGDEWLIESQLNYGTRLSDGWVVSLDSFSTEASTDHRVDVTPSAVIVMVAKAALTAATDAEWFRLQHLALSAWDAFCADADTASPEFASALAAVQSIS